MPDAEASLPRPPDHDLFATVRFLRIGRRDPTMRLTDSELVRTMRTPDGPATLFVRAIGDRFAVKAFGPAAQRAVDAAPALLGLEDDPSAFAPSHRRLARMLAEQGPVYMPRVDAWVESLVPIVLQQLVTFAEAASGWLRLVSRFGETAPGPLPLKLFPDPKRLVRQPVHVWRQLGVGSKRAATIVRICERAGRIEALREQRLDVVREKLTSLRGIGPWTVESFCGMCLGDADALAPGDIHLPNDVAWALAGEARADDARMFELLEPFRPHRWRVIRLLYHAGFTAPRRGPKRAIRSPGA
ncbi:MAG: DNA-3-methyladenine glycosylase 2 family protein [Myxococcota bacterium]